MSCSRDHTRFVTLEQKIARQQHKIIETAESGFKEKRLSRKADFKLRVTTEAKLTRFHFTGVFGIIRHLQLPVYLLSLGVVGVVVLPSPNISQTHKLEC